MCVCVCACARALMCAQWHIILCVYMPICVPVHICRLYVCELYVYAVYNNMWIWCVHVNHAISMSAALVNLKFTQDNDNMYIQVHIHMHPMHSQVAVCSYRPITIILYVQTFYYDWCLRFAVTVVHSKIQRLVCTNYIFENI